MVPMAWGTAVALAATCGMLLSQRGTEHEQMWAEQVRQTSLLASLADAHGTIGGLEGRVEALQKESGVIPAEMVEELGAAKRHVAITERELALMRVQVSDLRKIVTASAGLQGDLLAAKDKLVSSQKRVGQLEVQLKTESQRVKELEGQELANKELAGTVEQLKEQAVMLAVQSEVLGRGAKPTLELPEPRTEGGTMGGQWALPIRCDRAMDFMVSQFSHESVVATRGGDGTIITTAVLPENAATMRVVHDTEKQRVYSATLTLSLAADSPRVKRTENLQLIHAFIKTIAPSSDETQEWIADVVKKLAGKDSAERVMRVGPNYKLTVWNNKMGMYTWRIESPRGEVE